jgi:hypothetical protein
MKRTRTRRGLFRNKYSFSEYLVNVGDFVQTEPLPKREAYNIYIAAHMWAWDRSCRVAVESYPVDDNRVVRIKLISNHRERDYK